jgi:hypothetical protein
MYPQGISMDNAAGNPVMAATAGLQRSLNNMANSVFKKQNKQWVPRAQSAMNAHMLNTLYSYKLLISAWTLLQRVQV